MSEDETPKARQDNEIQVLNAIFNEDLRDLRPSDENTSWKPLDIVITLSPLQGSSGLREVHAQVDLHITCSENYPDIEPNISLERSRGMSLLLLAELQKQLEEKSLQLVGEVMIFELAQHVQAFLHEHNKPGTKSFYEEMINRQKQQKDLLLEAKKLEEIREREVMQNEILRRQEILLSEVKSRREYTINNETDSNNYIKKNSRKSFNSICETDNEYSCEHRGTELLIFESSVEKKVQKGRCLSHCSRGCIIYSGLDLASGDLYAIHEWKIDTNDHYEISHYQNKVTSVEQEFIYLSKLRHANLVKYFNMKTVQDKNQLIIYILQEFILGSNCNSLFLKEGIPCDTDMLRYITQGVLNSLDFLHRNNVVHKDIRDSCIYLDNNGLVKLAGYSLEVKLTELFCQIQNTETYSKKTDVLRLGLFILSLYKGSLVENSDTELPGSLPGDLEDFLTKCLSKSDKRPSVAQLLQHPFVSAPLYRMSPKRVYKQAPITEVTPSHNSHTDMQLFSQNRSGGTSRIQHEFEVLQWLGKGAFGDVIKVKNKLDGGYYALKRIELNPKNKLLNRKITREVKLLSRLNHENVVRYYNSWIESAVIENAISEESSECTSQRESTQQRSPVKKVELSFGNDVELLAPPIRDVEWSISYESKSKCHSQNAESSSSEEESSEDEDWMGFLPNHADSSDSDSIEFERTGNEDIDEVDSTTTDIRSSNKTVSPERTREIQFMYIQMEFCEKSTLRTAIDAELYKDTNRVWRLFREIVEGLAHIHQQGMIHRDLKPVNIFLDSNDHVKIGDFGLATTNIIPRQTLDVMSKNNQESEREMSQDAGDGSLTGHVGTALYVAPELTSTSKVIYNQKVDIYSLGIILFEMFYSSFTGMERIKVLSCLRLKEVIFPQEFLDAKYSKPRTVIRLLLNHDVSKRPTSQELLQSEHLPPPVLEECELRELVRHTLSHPQSKAYKYLVASCFSQQLSHVDDVTYDMSVPNMNRPLGVRGLQVFEFAKQGIVKIFKLHGGQCMSTPLLMPKSEYYKGIESCVNLMTHSGSIISIPHDLRVPFARYVALNNVTLMKRYSIERVYREKKTFGFHPREMYECAFDIVTPNAGSFMADAEVLSIIYEIVNEFSVLKNKNYTIRLNHTSLLRAILLHCGIPAEKHNEIYSILSDARDGNFTKFQIKTHLVSLCLSDSEVLTLFRMIESEYPINKVSNNLKSITKRKGEASDLAKKGLSELTAIIENIEALGVKCNIVIALGMVCNVQLYSGMMFQFVCELKKKRRRGGLDVLAAGGRYDDMLSNFRINMERSGMATKTLQCAVGISISLDKLIQALQEQKYTDMDELTDFYTVICSLGRKPLLKEKTKLLQDLRSAGIRCTLLESQSLEEIQEQCNELNVKHIVILKDTEQGLVHLFTREKDRFQDKRLNISEVTDYLQRQMKSRSDTCSDTYTYVNPVASRSDTRVSTGDRDRERDREHSTSSLPMVSINFVFGEGGKLAVNARKRLENQIFSNMESTLLKLSNKEQVVILALQMEASIIRTLASCLDLESEASVRRSMGYVIEKHSRHKKYLDEVSNEIQDYFSEKCRPVFALYSTHDGMFKLLL